MAVAGGVAAAQQQQEPLTANLAGYMLHTARPSGTKLLTGMALSQVYTPKAKKINRRALRVALQPHGQDGSADDAAPVNLSAPRRLARGGGPGTMILNPTDAGYTIEAIVRASGGTGGSEALQKRKPGAI